MVEVGPFVGQGHLLGGQSCSVVMGMTPRQSPVYQGHNCASLLAYDQPMAHIGTGIEAYQNLNPHLSAKSLVILMLSMRDARRCCRHCFGVIERFTSASTSKEVQSAARPMPARPGYEETDQCLRMQACGICIPDGPSPSLRSIRTGRMEHLFGGESNDGRMGKDVIIRRRAGISCEKDRAGDLEHLYQQYDRHRPQANFLPRPHLGLERPCSAKKHEQRMQRRTQRPSELEALAGTISSPRPNEARLNS